MMIAEIVRAELATMRSSAPTIPEIKASPSIEFIIGKSVQLGRKGFRGGWIHRDDLLILIYDKTGVYPKQEDVDSVLTSKAYIPHPYLDRWTPSLWIQSDHPSIIEPRPVAAYLLAQGL